MRINKVSVYLLGAFLSVPLAYPQAVQEPVLVADVEALRDPVPGLMLEVGAFDGDIRSLRSWPGIPISVDLWPKASNIWGFRAWFGPAPVEYYALSLWLNSNKSLSWWFSFDGWTGGNRFWTGWATDGHEGQGIWGSFWNSWTTDRIPGWGPLRSAGTQARTASRSFTAPDGTITLNVFDGGFWALRFSERPYDRGLGLWLETLERGQGAWVEGEVVIH